MTDFTAKHQLDLTDDPDKIRSDFWAAERELQRRQADPWVAKLPADQRAEFDALVADGYEAHVEYDQDVELGPPVVVRGCGVLLYLSKSSPKGED